jgi:hypothetical protein
MAANSLTPEACREKAADGERRAIKAEDSYAKKALLELARAYSEFAENSNTRISTGGSHRLAGSGWSGSQNDIGMLGNHAGCEIL